MNYACKFYSVLRMIQTAPQDQKILVLCEKKTGYSITFLSVIQIIYIINGLERPINLLCVNIRSKYESRMHIFWLQIAISPAFENMRVCNLLSLSTKLRYDALVRLLKAVLGSTNVATMDNLESFNSGSSKRRVIVADSSVAGEGKKN